NATDQNGHLYCRCGAGPVFFSTFFRSRGDCLRSQLRPEPGAAVGVWRRHRLDRPEDSETGAGPESDDSIREPAVPGYAWLRPHTESEPDRFHLFGQLRGSLQAVDANPECRIYPCLQPTERLLGQRSGYACLSRLQEPQLLNRHVRQLSERPADINP